MSGPIDHSEEALFGRIARIIDAARGRVVRSVNSAMVHAYWAIGLEIVEVEQAGRVRAGYGEQLVERLSARLAERFGKGFSTTNVKRMRQFYLAFPNGSFITGTAGRTSAPDDEIGPAVRHQFQAGSRWQFPAQLSWTHYRQLVTVDDPAARAFYEIEAARENWSSRELERQIASLLYERLSRSRDRQGVLALARDGLRVAKPRDVLKDPLVLEFLELEERSTWLERDLEQAIIDRLESFLLEFGKGFCFVARQKRLTLDGDHFYVDLVFYNRLLRCFVLVDLKLGKLDHGDLGQMQMYVNYYDRFERAEWESPTVGIILCSEKNDAMVRITLPDDNEQILASRYLLYLPSESRLRDELVAERERVEHHRRVAAGEPAGEISDDEASD